MDENREETCEAAAVAAEGWEKTQEEIIERGNPSRDRR